MAAHPARFDNFDKLLGSRAMFQTRCWTLPYRRQGQPTVCAWLVLRDVIVMIDARTAIATISTVPCWTVVEVSKVLFEINGNGLLIACRL